MLSKFELKFKNKIIKFYTHRTTKIYYIVNNNWRFGAKPQKNFYL